MVPRKQIAGVHSATWKMSGGSVWGWKGASSLLRRGRLEKRNSRIVVVGGVLAAARLERTNIRVAARAKLVMSSTWIAVGVGVEEESTRLVEMLVVDLELLGRVVVAGTGVADLVGIVMDGDILSGLSRRKTC